MSKHRRVRVTDHSGTFDFEGDFLGWGADFAEFESGADYVTAHAGLNQKIATADNGAGD